MIYLTAILVLMLCSALFSACETAFSSVNKIRLKSDAMQGNQRAARALALAESFDRALTAILIGNNLVNILSASLGTILFTRWFGEGGVGSSTMAMTVLVLIFGEILPKNYAKAHAEQMTLFFAAPLRALKRAKLPVLFFHGTADTLVPVRNSYENYAYCAADKKLILVDGAEHIQAYYTEPETYEREVAAFFDEHDAVPEEKS